MLKIASEGTPASEDASEAADYAPPAAHGRSAPIKRPHIGGELLICIALGRDLLTVKRQSVCELFSACLQRLLSASIRCQSSALQPFHLAFPVRDVAEAKEFYGAKLGLQEGRTAKAWVDYSLFGHQIVCHHIQGYNAANTSNAGVSRSHEGHANSVALLGNSAPTQVGHLVPLWDGTLASASHTEAEEEILQALLQAPGLSFPLRLLCNASCSSKTKTMSHRLCSIHLAIALQAMGCLGPRPCCGLTLHMQHFHRAAMSA